MRDKVLARESVFQMRLHVCGANYINRTVEKTYSMLASTRGHLLVLGKALPEVRKQISPLRIP